MDTTLLHSVTLSTLALVVVLLLRRPARRMFGAGPAFGLWLLPVLALLLPWLPALPASWQTLPAIEVLPGGLAADTTAIATSAHLPWLRGLWLAGAVLMLARLGAHYVGLRRSCRPLPPAMAATLHDALDGFDARHLRLHASGPAVLWAPRSLILLPADFPERHDAGERALVLRHELTHLRRGDALWSLLAELALALLWFHPLAWLARPRFRLDQELACDAAVLRAAPQIEADYAHGLLHSVGIAPMPTLIPWLAEPQLKERLTMIERHRPGALRRRAGYAALAVLLAGGVFVAQAATDHRAEQNLSYNARIQPHYPLAAIKGGEQGTVVLAVQVLPDGSVGTITYDAKGSTTHSADLIAAATNAAQQWHFNPQIENGKPVTGVARVPVEFALDLIPGRIDKSEVEKQSSKYKKVN